ncbi:DNA repair protein RadC [bacterium]|nr:DNA repair protein RadC [bacterium]
MHNTLPRECLAQLGAKALRDDQLIALVLRSGARNDSVHQLAQRLADLGLERLQSFSFEEWLQLDGLGEAKAASLIAALELGRRSLGTAGPPVTTPEEAYVQLQDLAGARKETFKALYLDGRRRLLRAEVVSVGTLTATLVHPREVFAPALECGAASLVVAHNHPSGDPTPSHEDRLLTERLCQAGRLLGLNLDDHLVIGKGCFVSLRQLGLLVA